MIDDMEIESHQFDDINYVLIKVDIGKMPPQATRKYIANLRENTALCKELDSRGIPFDIFGVRDNSSGLSVEPKTEKPKAKVTTGRGTEIEKLPGEQGQDKMDDMAYFRQKAIRSAAQFTVALDVDEIEKSTKKNNVVVADRSDLLKSFLTDDIKKDSFADAMKLVEE